jgi:hypothetical protein
VSVCASVYQPQFFPRLHYVNRVLDSDVFVILASAQYTKSMTHHLEDGSRERRKTYQAHTPIKQHDGEYLITLPVSRPGRLGTLEEMQPQMDRKWRARYGNTLTAAYGRTPYFDARFPEAMALLEGAEGSLAELNTSTLLWAIDLVLDLGVGMDRLNVDNVNDALATRRGGRLRRLVHDRDTGVARPEGARMGGPWTAALCAAVGADEYLHGGTASAGYMDPAEYTARGLTLRQQHWEARPYPQAFTDRLGFLPNLSVLDLLFNVPPADAFPILYPAEATAGASRVDH